MGFSASEISKMKFEHLALREPWLDIVGKPSSNSSILMYSRPGSGKSSIALQLADELTRHGIVGYMAAEEGISPTLQEKLERLNLTNTAIQFYDPENLEDIKAFALRENLDALFVDSFTVFDKKLRLFEEFRLWAKQNEIFFVTIVQTTKDGKFYGNADAAFNVDCVLQVIDGKPSTEATGKNRLGELYEHDTDLRAKPVKPVPEKEAKRVNPEPLRFNPVDAELLHGLEYIENPAKFDGKYRENRGVSPDDIYQMITDRILATLEKAGKLPWHKPWAGSGIGNGLTATNFVSKKPYRGINFFLLNFEMQDGELVPRKFDNPYFLTFNQINKLKGKLTKGSKGKEVIYFTRLYSYEHESGKPEIGTYSLDKFKAFLRANSGTILGAKRRITRSDGMPTLLPNPTSMEKLMEDAENWYVPLLKYYNVYSAEDVTGIDWGEIPKNDNTNLPEFQKIEVAELIWDHYPAKPPVKHKEARAYYSPSGDFINMPPKVSFDNEQYYYSTLFHEGVHSTGAEKRLSRDFSGRFGDESYAFEELIAELGAAFLCAESGILFYTIDNTTAYLQGWKKRLVKNMEDDNRFFFRASSRAQAAADYIFDLNDEGVPAYRAKLAETLASEVKTTTKKKAKGKKTPSAEKVKAKSFKEFQKESPVLWGHITVNGNTKFGQFKVKHNKYTNKAEYTYYTEKGNRGTGGFTFAKAFSLYNDKKLTESRSDWLEIDKPKAKTPEKAKTKPKAPKKAIAKATPKPTKTAKGSYPYKIASDSEVETYIKSGGIKLRSLNDLKKSFLENTLLKKELELEGDNFLETVKIRYKINFTTATGIRNALNNIANSVDKHIFIYPNSEISKKIVKTTTPKIDSMRTDQFVYGNSKINVFTDGHVLIYDAKIAKELLDKEIEKEYKKLVKQGLPPKEAKEYIAKTTKNQAPVNATSIMPDISDYKGQSTLIGYIYTKTKEHANLNIIMAVVASHENVISFFNIDYLGFMAKQLPSSEMRTNAGSKMSVFVNKKTINGLIMPLLISESDASYFTKKAVFDSNFRKNPNKNNDIFRLNGTDETFIYLGTIEKLDVDSPYTAGLEGSGLRMFSNQAQNKLYIIPQELVKAAKFKVDDSKASNLFKEWHNYAADHKDLEISYPSTSKKEKIGTASKIWYRSDKVMQAHDKKGKQNYYVHDFDANKRPVYVQGSVMIIENIKWNERGILN